eukprot:2080552-Rhodomonas_salina.3
MNLTRPGPFGPEGPSSCLSAGRSMTRDRIVTSIPSSTRSSTSLPRSSKIYHHAASSENSRATIASNVNAGHPEILANPPSHLCSPHGCTCEPAGARRRSPALSPTSFPTDLSSPRESLAARRPQTAPEVDQVEELPACRRPCLDVAGQREQTAQEPQQRVWARGRADAWIPCSVSLVRGVNQREGRMPFSILLPGHSKDPLCNGQAYALVSVEQQGGSKPPFELVELEHVTQHLAAASPVSDIARCYPRVCRSTRREQLHCVLHHLLSPLPFCVQGWRGCRHLRKDLHQPGVRITDIRTGHSIVNLELAGETLPMDEKLHVVVALQMLLQRDCIGHVHVVLVLRRDAWVCRKDGRDELE